MLHWHHIIPKHAGGTDDPSNLKQYTIEGHAEEHRKRYEEFGERGDWLAYRGLLKLITKKDILKELCSRKGKDNPNYGKCGELNPLFGRKRPEHSKLMKIVMKGKKKSKKHLENWIAAFRRRSEVNPVATKSWKVITPTGEKLSIRNMAKFCRERSLSKSEMSGSSKTGKFHKGYKAIKIGKS